MVACESCNREFNGRMGQKFCSRACYVGFNRHEKTCKNCGIKFFGTFRQRKCSSLCRPTVGRRQCLQCAFEFTYTQRRCDKKFCSKDCFSLWSRGRINRGQKSDEHRLKISKSLKGRCTWHRSGGPGPGRRPYTMPKSHRQAISRGRRGMKFTIEHRKAISRGQVRRFEGRRFNGTNLKYMSTKVGEEFHAHSHLELDYMKLLDNDTSVVTWTKRHGVTISYLWNESNRLYLPDFLVEYADGRCELHETKGYEFEPTRCRAKEVAAMKYCDLNDLTYRVIRRSDFTT